MEVALNPFLPPLLSAALRDLHDFVACVLFAAALTLLAVAFGG